jgi:hypothetical protein
MIRWYVRRSVMVTSYAWFVYLPVFAMLLLSQEVLEGSSQSKSYFVSVSMHVSHKWPVSLHVLSPTERMDACDERVQSEPFDKTFNGWLVVGFVGSIQVECDR